MDTNMRIELLPRDVLEQRVGQELKHLIAWRALPHRLISYAALRYVLGVDEDIDPRSAGEVMHRRLRCAIDERSGSATFDAYGITVTLSDHQLNRLFKVLLGYEATGELAPTRRRRVIAIIGVRCTDDTWRRQPERRLMQILADHLVSRRLDPPREDSQRSA
jgi:hypothetical protein